jgi:phosphatidylglycerol lysyltransferase
MSEGIGRSGKTPKKTGRVASCIGLFIAVFLFLAACRVLHRTFAGLRLADIRQALGSLPLQAIGRALILTVVNYLVLAGYDRLALKYIRKNIGNLRPFLAAFMGCAFSAGLGFAAVTGSSVRIRLYSGWGLDRVEIAKILFFCNLTVCLGVATTVGVSFLAQSHLVSLPGIASPLAARITGALLLCAVTVYLLFCTFHRRTYSFRGEGFSLPSLRLSVGQVLVSSADLACAAGVLYMLMPASSAVSYLQFLAVFLVAQTAGLLSQVPGGLGVLESIIVTIFPPVVPARDIVASFVVYRAVYYLLPLIIATGTLVTHEAFEHRRQVGSLIGLFGKWRTGALL